MIDSVGDHRATLLLRGVVVQAQRIQIFRVRVVLRVTKDVKKLHAYHAGLIYALLARAYGIAESCPQVLPDGVMVDCPEQCRIRIEAGEEYAFGFTLLGTPEDAQRIVSQLVFGLETIGATRQVGGGILNGNFSVRSVTDLVSGARLANDQSPQPVSDDHLESEFTRLTAAASLTIRLESPLRMSRPKKRKIPGHGFFDQDWFHSDLFVNRTLLRCQRLGYLSPDQPPIEVDYDREADVERSLMWLDVSYGSKKAGKTLGGALGTVRIPVRNPQHVQPLVWGQYLAVGESTHFGFGRYRIVDLGSRPYACYRAELPLRLIFNSPSLDIATQSMNLPAGRVRHLVGKIRSGRYRPSQPQIVKIPRKNGGNRTLTIPIQEDRALQRAVLDWLAPALDKFFESSSLAYRKGLGRHRAAQRIRNAYREGFVWALRADIHEFFDSVAHDLLESRLAAYIADPPLVQLVMAWVRCTASGNRGIPTGAPLSPLLSNLVLDQFDEAVDSEGGRLVRYADDFMILVKEEAHARRMYERAREEVESLRLVLNEEKASVIDLREPFHFLGFRFQKTDQWIFDDDGLTKARDLGWQDSHAHRPQAHFENYLPGEEHRTVATEESSIVLGPSVEWIGAAGGNLVVGHGHQSPYAAAKLDEIACVTAMGPPTVASDLIEELSKRNIPLLLTTKWGKVVSSLWPPDHAYGHAAIREQLAAAEDEPRARGLAGQLVTAKLRNHAALVMTLQARGWEAVADQLNALAEGCWQVESVGQLLGKEGAGAAIWYRHFSKLVPPAFPFETRAKPRATDPVNVVLNICQSQLYRYVTSMIQLSGLAPTLGFLHSTRPGHSALASDLQEPFRHLMDLAALHALRRLRPADFKKTKHGPFRLRISTGATRIVLEQVHRQLAIACRAKDASESRFYRQQVLHMVRSLRSHLFAPTQPFRVFEHPKVAGRAADRSDSEWSASIDDST